MRISQFPFIASVDERPSVRVIRLKGAIVKDTIPQMEKLREQLCRQKDFERKNIILDAADVTDFDSATVAALLLWMKEMKEESHRLAFINVSEKMKGMAEVFQVEE